MHEVLDFDILLEAAIDFGRPIRALEDGLSFESVRVKELGGRCGIICTKIYMDGLP